MCGADATCWMCCISGMGGGCSGSRRRTTGCLRIGGTMGKLGEPALNNSGVIAFPAAIFKGPALGGIFVTGARDLRLLVGAGDRAPSGAMILRFSERVAIDDEDGVAFGTYLGTDGV